MTDTSIPDAALAQQLVDLHFNIWNDPEPKNWPTKFSQAYAPNFSVADPKALASGYVSVGQLIQRVQSEHAGFVFTPDPITWNHGLGRVTWGYGPRSNPNLVRGEDIFTIKDGKLASMHVFLNKQ